MFPAPWTQISPLDAPIRAGRLSRCTPAALGLLVLNACRIVYVIDEDGAGAALRFRYGTLPAHVEQGRNGSASSCTRMAQCGMTCGRFRVRAIGRAAGETARARVAAAIRPRFASGDATRGAHAG